MKKSQAGIKAIAAQLQATPNPVLFKFDSFDRPFNSTPRMRQLWQQLEAEVQHVNQLATAQEAAVLRLKAIVQRVERDPGFAASCSEPLNVWQFLPDDWQSDSGQMQEPIEIPCISIPYVERTETGDLKLAARLIDLASSSDPAPSEQQRVQPGGDRGKVSKEVSNQVSEEVSELEFTALLPSVLSVLQQAVLWSATTFLPLGFAGVQAIVQLLGVGVQLGGTAIVAVSTRAAAARRSKRLYGQSCKRESFRNSSLEQPSDSIQPVAIFPSAQEALTLTVGATLLRILLDRLSLLYPALSLISILLMICPAAIAVYRTTVAPPSGFLWGCRLTLIMLGLLLGGRV